MSLLSVAQKYGHCGQVVRDTATGFEYVSWDIAKSLQPFNQPLIFNIGRRNCGKTIIGHAIVNALAPVTRTVWVCKASAHGYGHWNNAELRRSLEIDQGISFVHQINEGQIDTEAIMSHQRRVLVQNCDHSLMVCIFEDFAVQQYSTPEFIQFVLDARNYNICVVLSCQWINGLPLRIRNARGAIVVLGCQPMRTARATIMDQWMAGYRSRSSLNACHRVFDILTEDYRHIVAIQGEVLWFRAGGHDEHKRIGDAQTLQRAQVFAMQSLVQRHIQSIYFNALLSMCIPDLASIICTYLDMREPIQTAIDVVRNGVEDSTQLALAYSACQLAGAEPEWPLLVPVKTVVNLEIEYEKDIDRDNDSDSDTFPVGSTTDD